MKRIVFMFTALSLVYGLQYDGLRVKIGWSDALADREYFFKIPRTIGEAEALAWRRTERPRTPLPELRMYCPPGRAVCPLFDTAGFVAGLQLALPVDKFETLAVKPEKNFVKWSAPAFDGEPAREYWTITQYYVSEESLKSGAGPTIENGATLQDGGVWVKGHDGLLLRIPTTVAELNTTKFRRQNCVPNMGTHYYYNMSNQMKCENLLPWFPMTTQGELVGVGFLFYGKLSKPVSKGGFFETPHISERQWFEVSNSAPRQSIELTIPDAPPCLYEWSATYGVVTLHIYYIDQPWNIRCSTGDSVKPAPAVDRLLLTGYRYANQIADEFKKIFSG